MNITKSRLAVVAAGALVITAIAGTGGAVAGALITSADIKDKTIQKWDLAPGSVTSGKIVDGTIGLQDMSSTTKAALKGDPGTSAGPTVLWVTKTDPGLAYNEDSDIDNLDCPEGMTIVDTYDGNGYSYSASRGQASVGAAASYRNDHDTTDATSGLDNIQISTDALSGTWTATASIACM